MLGRLRTLGVLALGVEVAYDLVAQFASQVVALLLVLLVVALAYRPGLASGGQSLMRWQKS